MQVNRRIKGRKDNVRLIDGEHGFTGAQNANTAKGTARKDNVEFGETGTFIAKGKIERNDELLIKYDGNRTGGVILAFRTCYISFTHLQWVYVYFQ